MYGSRGKLLTLSGVALMFVTLWPSTASAQTTSEATRVRILLVVDTNGFNADALKLGLAGENMKKTMKEVLRNQNLEHRYTLDVLTGADVSPSAIRQYYEKLAVESNETLLFYYLGHGAADKNKGHFLDMKQGRLYRSELRQVLKSKNARLTIILTDSCAPIEGTLPENLPGNNMGGKTKAKAEKVVTSKSESGKNSGTALRQLLLLPKGIVDINSSRIGTVAWVDLVRGGGYFSLTLMALAHKGVATFDTNGNGIVEWGEFFSVLQRQTAVNASQDPHGPYFQRAIAFELPEVPVVK
jgi:hypothetical protein